MWDRSVLCNDTVNCAAYLAAVAAEGRFGMKCWRNDDWHGKPCLCFAALRLHCHILLDLLVHVLQSPWEGTILPQNCMFSLMSVLMGNSVISMSRLVLRCCSPFISIAQTLCKMHVGIFRICKYGGISNNTAIWNRTENRRDSGVSHRYIRTSLDHCHISLQ